MAMTAASIYAIGVVTAALLWKPLSIAMLVAIFLTPAVAAALVGLVTVRRVRPLGPTLLLNVVILPIAAAIMIGGPATILAWLLSQ